jgi:hypothetical protein
MATGINSGHQPGRSQLFILALEFAKIIGIRTVFVRGRELLLRKNRGVL